MGFRGSFVGLGKFREDIFLSRFSTKLPLKSFFFGLSWTAEKHQRDRYKRYWGSRCNSATSVAKLVPILQTTGECCGSDKGNN